MIHYARSTRFLAAAFDSEEALHEWFDAVPADRRDTLVKRTDGHSFPCFLVETDDFRWIDEAELAELFATCATDGHAPDRVYMNLYFLKGPWQPPRAGSDFMGSLPHLHVERRHLELAEREGLDALHASWLSPASRTQLRRRTPSPAT